MSQVPKPGPTPYALAATPRGLATWKLSHLLILVFGVSLFLWAYATIGGWAVVLLVLLLVMMLVASAFVAIRRTSSQRYSLLWMLAIAADHRMPVAMAVEAFADQYRGFFRRRVRRLSSTLGLGAPLSHALRSVPGLASSESSMLVEMGEETGRLGSALRQAASLQSARSAVGSLLASQAGYLLGVLLITEGIAGFLVYFVMPKYEAILADFGMPMPRATAILASASHTLVEIYAPLWLPLLTLALLVSVPAMLATGLAFEFPVLGRLFRRRHTALILRSLAMAAETGRPIERGLLNLASRYPTGWVRRRLTSVENEVRRGVDWRDALARQNLIRPADYEVLAAASAVGNLPWAMNDLAEAAERRMRLRLALLARAIWPLAIIAFGSLMLFMAVGFFLPLIVLIGRLSG